MSLYKVTLGRYLWKLRFNPYCWYDTWSLSVASIKTVNKNRNSS